jgi:hypothetical protein
VYAGHAALALLAKSRRPKLPLLLLVPVAFAPDWIEWVCDAFGFSNKAISHSLVSVGIGATLVALLWFAANARDAGGAGVLWLLYGSHWAADFITGTKPTWPGGPDVGLMLYAHPGWDAVMECVIIVLCWLAYRRSLPTESRNRALTGLIPLGLIAMQIAFAAVGDPRVIFDR